MFSFVKERKAKAALAAVAPGVVPLLQSVPSPHRGCTLAVANALLLSGAAQWGQHFSHSPMKLSPETAYDAICALSDRHAQMEAAIDDLTGRPASDPQVDACRWELAATQTVMMTAGARTSREYAHIAREAWKILSPARRHADDSVRLLTRFAKAYSVSPVPEVRGRKADPAWLRSLASSLPPMFRTETR